MKRKKAFVPNPNDTDRQAFWLVAFLLAFVVTFFVPSLPDKQMLGCLALSLSLVVCHSLHRHSLVGDGGTMTKKKSSAPVIHDSFARFMVWPKGEYKLGKHKRFRYVILGMLVTSEEMPGFEVKKNEIIAETSTPDFLKLALEYMTHRKPKFRTSEAGDVLLHLKDL